MSKVIDKEFSAALEYLTDSRIREIVSSKSVARVRRRLINDLLCWIGRFTEDDGDLRR
jgi:hypothetical protein